MSEKLMPCDFGLCVCNNEGKCQAAEKVRESCKYRRAERTGQWIRVEDKLPEHDEKVLCCYHFCDYTEMVFMKVLDYYATDEVPHFQHESAGWMKVTHWKPLPEVPKVNANE